MIIAIDGPAGSGKSSTAKKIAQQLNFMHIDTGAMYRAVTLYILQYSEEKIESLHDEEISTLLEKINIRFSQDGKSIFLNDEDVTGGIRENNVSQHVSFVSALPQVRNKMVELQREIAGNLNVILDGRDIGTRVFPNAHVKIYLNAHINERGRRRFEELEKQGVEISLEEVIKDIEIRDFKDSTRKHSPLMKADDAIEINTTSLTIDEQVNEIVSIIQTYNKTGERLN
jgi:cytidylate kinase